jgi:hypothetical protein
MVEALSPAVLEVLEGQVLEDYLIFPVALVVLAEEGRLCFLLGQQPCIPVPVRE